jgi:hypothetical protein
MKEFGAGLRMDFPRESFANRLLHTVDLSARLGCFSPRSRSVSTSLHVQCRLGSHIWSRCSWNGRSIPL